MPPTVAPRTSPGESGEQAGGLRLVGLFSGVLHVDVRHFVGHDPCEFGFVAGGRDGADVDEHLSAGQGEGVDVFLRDDVKFKRPGVLGRDGGDKLLPELADVLRLGTGVGQDGHLLIDLRGGLQAELALLVA